MRFDFLPDSLSSIGVAPPTGVAPPQPQPTLTPPKPAPQQPQVPVKEMPRAPINPSNSIGIASLGTDLMGQPLPGFTPELMQRWTTAPGPQTGTLATPISTGQPEAPAAGIGNPITTATTDWQAYLDAYPDVAQAYIDQNLVNNPHLLNNGGDYNRDGSISNMEYARWHQQTFGRALPTPANPATPFPRPPSTPPTGSAPPPASPPPTGATPPSRMDRPVTGLVDTAFKLYNPERFQYLFDKINGNS